MTPKKGKNKAKNKDVPETEARGEDSAEAPGDIPEDKPGAEAETSAPEDAPEEIAEDGGKTDESPPESEEQEPEEGPPEEGKPEKEDPEAPETQIAALKDKLLRALAEAENVRRRAQRDKEDASRYAIANFAREMLSVSDNLKRAMDSVDAETREKDPAVEQIMVGLDMTAREINNIFERSGIRTIEALGQKFDHNRHEAMFEVDDASKPAGTVVQEVETGFMLHDRLLRPAKVGVSKGGPKENGDAENAAPPAASAPPAAPDDAAAKEGQAAYEDKGGDPGARLDEEL